MLNTKKITSETRSKFISIIIFSAAILISLFSFNQILFPKLLIELTSEYANLSDNIFELGIWGVPFLVSNIAFGIIWFCYKFLKIPIRKYIKSLLDFDLSKKVTILCLIVLFSIYLALSVGELSQTESFNDYSDVLQGVEELAFFTEGEGESEDKINIYYLRFLFLKISVEIFDNIRFLPFLSSLALLSLTYLFTAKISGKRISGIVALIIVIQSNLFHIFDTTATYENFWTTFFLLSLYLILRKPYLSPISFIVSILTKIISFLFLPIIISFILSVDESVKKKKKILLVYSFFPILLIAGLFVPSAFSLEQFVNIDMRNMLTGFSAISMALRFDGLILLSFFPVIFLLYAKSRNNFRYANFLLVSLAMMLLIPPITSGVAGFTIQPYRLIPLVIMFSISVGYLFSKKNLTIHHQH